MGADQTPLDLKAIRARLDATSPGMTVDVHDGGSTLRATGNATDRPGFVGAVTGLVGALGGETGQLRLTFADDEDGQDATFALHAAADLRRLLDENARLNAELRDWQSTARFEERRADGLVEAYQQTRAQREEARAELDKVIREAAADKAKTEELVRENRVLRLEPSNARFDEVVGEKNQAIDDWYEAAKARDELACKVEAVRRTINPRNPGWKPLSERYPEYFEPDSVEEAARKKGWRQGVDLLTQRIKAALDGPTAAPEMPRPPAEEGAMTPDEETEDVIRGQHQTTVRGGNWVSLRCDCRGWELEVPAGLDAMPRLKAAHAEHVAEMVAEGTRPPAQEPVSGPETPGAGSGRGTGVAGAQELLPTIEFEHMDGVAVDIEHPLLGDGIETEYLGETAGIHRWRLINPAPGISSITYPSLPVPSRGEGTDET